MRLPDVLFLLRQHSACSGEASGAVLHATDPLFKGQYSGRPTPERLAGSIPAGGTCPIRRNPHDCGIASWPGVRMCARPTRLKKNAP